MELKLLHKILENDRWNANKVTNWGGAPWFYIYVVCKAKQKLHYFLNVFESFHYGYIHVPYPVSPFISDKLKHDQLIMLLISW